VCVCRTAALWLAQSGLTADCLVHGHGERLAQLLCGDGDVGMCVGIERTEWGTVQAAVPELHGPVYAATGGAGSVAFGRLLFMLGLVVAWKAASARVCVRVGRAHVFSCAVWPCGCAARKCAMAHFRQYSCLVSSRAEQRV
jgi:hypothetical protein